MAAFNWIEIDGECPSCGRAATLRCQTHVASDFGGDDTGRFCNRVYRLGDPMAWWPRDHRKYASWREDSEPDQPEDQAVEACYASCTACGAELYAVLRFHEVKAVEVLGVGLEVEWPANYSR
jgi:hypothetical protein